RRYEIVHVGLHRTEHRIVRAAGVAAAALPALALSPERLRRHDVLPLEPCRALRLAAHLIAAASVLDPPTGSSDPLPLTAAVRGAEQTAILVVVALLAHRDLGLIEGRRRCSDTRRRDEDG